MKTQIKKTIKTCYLRLSVFCLLSFSAVTVFAQGGTTGPLTWNISNDTLYISGNGAIPPSSYYPWENYSNSTTAIVITNGVTAIPPQAFYYFHRTTSISLPSSLMFIANDAFYYCSALTEIINNRGFPQDINYSVFAEVNKFFCVLRVPAGYVSNYETATGWEDFIHIYALEEEIIDICNELSPIEGSNLSWKLCSNGTLTISGIGDMPNFSQSPWYSHRHLIMNVVIEDSLANIGDWAFSDCINLTSITLPNSITSIGKYAFFYCRNLTSITLPNSITSIEYRTFAGCTNLTSITFPNSITSIEEAAFNGCSGLTSITLPNSITSIGVWAFSGCINLTSITFPNSITRIGGGAFSYCHNLTSITLPNSITSIGDWAFSNCYNLTSITFPNSITSIEEGAFSYCHNLTSITLPNSITSIEDKTFEGCTNLTSITFPNSITSIGERAFGYCGLTTVTIPENVASIVSSAFANCYFLMTVNYNAINCTFIPGITTPYYSPVFNNSPISTLNIGSMVQVIPEYTFLGCSDLTSITSHAVEVPVCGDFTFLGVSANIPVHIPCLSYLNYNNAPGWNNFTNFVINGYPTPDTTTYYFTKCYNVPYSDGNFTSPINQSGTYYTTKPNINNCDSIICLVLSEFSSIPDTYYSVTFCQGSNYTDVNFTNITEAGNHTVTLQNANGCDSIVRLRLTHPISPAQQLCMISVDNSYHNEIVWKRQEEIVSYNIYREGTQVGNYELVANVPYENPNTWVDMESNAKIRSYQYKVAGVDTCGNESVHSEAHKTMHLTISAGMNNSWNLIWTPYAGTDYSSYNIYRASGNTLDSLEMIGSMPASNTSYSDFFAPEGYVYYMIEIMLNEACDVSKSVSSIKSNIATNNPNVGIASATLSNLIQVYPNPTTGQLTINNYELRIKREDIELFDIMGRKQTIIINCQLSIVNSIDISHLPSGMYFLRVGNETVKVIKN